VSAGTEVRAEMSEPTSGQTSRASGRRGVKPGFPEPSACSAPGEAWLLLQEGRKSQLDYCDGSTLAPGHRLSRSVEASLTQGVVVLVPVVSDSRNLQSGLGPPKGTKARQQSQGDPNLEFCNCLYLHVRQIHTFFLPAGKDPNSLCRGGLYARLCSSAGCVFFFFSLVIVVCAWWGWCVCSCFAFVFACFCLT